jgi:hypothetical protein
VPLSVPGGTLRAVTTFTLSQLENAVRESWSAETTYARADYQAGAEGIASRGQCGPTALVVHDLLGGELVVAQVARADEVLGVHYWNRLSGGIDVDLTRDQFLPDETLHDPRVVERTGPAAGSPPDVAYQLLRSRVRSVLGLGSEPAWADAAQPETPRV